MVLTLDRPLQGRLVGALHHLQCSPLPEVCLSVRYCISRHAVRGGAYTATRRGPQLNYFLWETTTYSYTMLGVRPCRRVIAMRLSGTRRGVHAFRL